MSTIHPGYWPSRISYFGDEFEFTGDSLRWGPETEWGKRNRLFALVEGTSRFPPTWRLYGPEGEPIDINWPPDADRILEVRLCGFSASGFLEMMDDFEDLSERTPTPDERARRRQMLGQLFSNRSTPMLHAYLPYWHPIRLLWGGLFRAGQWWEVELNPAIPGESEANVFIDSPLEPDGENGPLTLTSIAMVPREIERRLRDVFSLAHVPDADFTDEEGGAGPESPEPPDGRPPTIADPGPSKTRTATVQSSDSTNRLAGEAGA